MEYGRGGPEQPTPAQPEIKAKDKEEEILAYIYMCVCVCVCVCGGIRQMIEVCRFGYIGNI